MVLLDAWEGSICKVSVRKDSNLDEIVSKVADIRTVFDNIDCNSREQK